MANKRGLRFLPLQRMQGHKRRYWGMDGREFSLLILFCNVVFVFQLPDLSQQSQRDPKRTEAEKTEDPEAEMKEEDYLFSTEELTESEKRRLNQKNTNRDVDVAKEEDEWKNRCHTAEEQTREVRLGGDPADCCVCEVGCRTVLS